MRIFLGVILFFLAPVLASAQSWYEPARGTAERKALMNALRPYAEYNLGAPVEFVVYDLRRSGHLAFASVWPQRPGGHQIDPLRTPAFARGEMDPNFLDGLGIQALFQQSGPNWIVVDWLMGAGDVWYAEPSICAVFRPVIPDACYGL